MAVLYRFCSQGSCDSSINSTVFPAFSLQGISTLTSRSPSLLPAALNTYKELLYSSLLSRMYGDAVASGNLEVALTLSRPVSFQLLESYGQTSVHISRADAFTCVHWMLGQVVCRYYTMYSHTLSPSLLSPSFPLFPPLPSLPLPPPQYSAGVM